MNECLMTTQHKNRLAIECQTNGKLKPNSLLKYIKKNIYVCF